ncbi:MAG: GIY-YIG nuclease family protein [Candidatus Bathyarchaeota archaeon]|nr:GIY-YIG nuclease family protein [Candidatus Bathyarchaeota archaeon]
MLSGIYALIVRLTEDTVVNGGAKGKLSFIKGTYVYVGSAQTNLEQRVKRHLLKDKRLFWHIDYLLDSPAANVVEVLYLQGDKAVECAVAQEISKQGDPIDGFGCSDCNCKSHLFRVVTCSFLRERMEPLDLKP